METLDPIDALMLTGELLSSPMHVAVMLIMSPPKGAKRAKFVDELYEQSLTSSDPVDPRLRRRPHRGVDTGGLWVWREEAELDPRHHVQRRTLPRGSGTAALWELVSELHAERLDRSAPLWMAYLIDGLAGGRFALYIKVHHILIDGVAGLQMIGDSLSDDPDRRSMPPFYAASAPADPSPQHRRRGPLSAMREVANAATSGLSLARHVAAAELANIVGSLTTPSVAPPFGAPHTRFNTKLGSRRAFAATSLDHNRIRAIQQAAGVTGNDVVTALVAAVLRSWLAEQDELPHQSLVALCPVTVRGRDAAGSDRHGNQFGLGMCPLGTSVEDPVQRLNLIHHAMANVKHQVAAQGPGAMLLVLMPAILPTVLSPLLPFTSWVRPSYNVPISNVPGPRQQMYYNGARVDEIYPVSTVYDGMALNVTLCSYADKIGVGYVADRDVVASIDDLIPLTETALAELEAAVGVT
ncbi:wax ester/triacylglycerol synthase family O-acyltransferase [Mycobacterium sp. CVI_P3]|uniref:Diacylglycerol O-acyltransferase n=1 Tax=Mycobacterium pinniadriaticum TaxID=2994102 RepID=A0ABT3SCB9_9MYCO|nr:wax ester/triacylglycerol synthase family O-acyltransferase [Mycobacterium pinniadriaticum]MCX2930715.1 wax ester/triacylglycerol synthase family O-acyltransferase [Mycobacterium pinniadriaticum]MCX2937139.1 wax ester/triacylglycerol synthase family O-acyltransferase [Mycobacterium pinniadriaticum]